MSEIKFRAWEKEMKEMILVEDISFKLRQINTTSAWRYFEEVELMQYTGMKDKDGAEIYEGDIVETQQSDLTSVPHEMVGGIVEWDSKNAMYKIKPLYGSKFHPITMFVRDVVVVGNIYENPELLKLERETEWK